MVHTPKFDKAAKRFLWVSKINWINSATKYVEQ